MVFGHGKDAVSGVSAYLTWYLVAINAMPRFLSISLITLALVVGAAGVVPAVTPTGLVWWPAAHAQGTGLLNDWCDDDSSSCDVDLVCVDNRCIADTNILNGDVAPVAPIITDGEEIPTTLPAALDNGGAFSGVMIFFMKIFAWLLGVAAVTLDNAVYYTVVTMGSYVRDLSAIGVTWRILRDLGNILLIFSFLAIGITIILNVDWYGGGTKLLPKLLIAAVLLNFSLFMTEAVIDVGNLFATQFYTQINGGIPAAPINYFNVSNISNEGISNKIMSQLGLATVYGRAISKDGVLDFANSPLIGFMSIILFMVAAFVMFSLAFILIARFVILIFLIIAAPVGVASYAVPQLSKYGTMWKDKLIQQTITAPVLLLLLYIALAVITDASFLGFGPTGDWVGFVPDSNGATNLVGFASMILTFLVAMGLLLIVVVASKSLSAFCADGASKLAGRLSFGAASLGGRVVLGGAGNIMAGKHMQSWARKNVALRPVVLAGKGLRSSTFDFRNAPGAAAGLGAIGINAGKGATITAKQAWDARLGVKPVQGWLQKGEEERQLAGHEMDFKKAQREIESMGTGPLTPAQQTARDEANKVITSALSKMTTKQIEELGGIKSGVDALVTNLSPQQFESLMKSDKLNQVEKDKIKETRYRSLDNTVRGGNTVEIKKAIGALSKGEIESMPAEILANPLILDNLSDKQRDTITESKERTAAEKTAVRNSSPIGKLEATFDNPALGPVAASLQISNLTNQQVAKLPNRILTNQWVTYKLTSGMLIALQEEKKLKSSEISTMTNNIVHGGLQSARDHVTTAVGAAFWS